MKHLIRPLIYVAIIILAPISQAELTESEQRTLAEYERQTAEYQKIAARHFKRGIREIKDSITQVKRDRTRSRPEREKLIEEGENIISSYESDIRAINKGEYVAGPYIEFQDIDVGDLGMVPLGEHLSGCTVHVNGGNYRVTAPDGERLLFFTAIGLDGMRISRVDPGSTVFEVVQKVNRNSYRLKAIDIDGLYDKLEQDKEDHENGLTDIERRALKSYLRDEKAYQPVAMRSIKKRIRTLQRQILEVKRDTDLSRNERERQAEKIEGEAEVLKEMLDEMRDGELVLLPELDFARLDVGDFGTITNGSHSLVGNHLSLGGTSSKWTAYNDEKTRPVCTFTVESMDGDVLFSRQYRFIRGEMNIFEVVEELDNPDENAKYPHFRLREINIESLMQKADFITEEE